MDEDEFADMLSLLGRFDDNGAVIAEEMVNEELVEASGEGSVRLVVDLSSQVFDHVNGVCE